ncbi:hypothetical protein SH668x_000038 [Planctomicrobium sp. SH668]|uniref:hypothetical protein n=1 Tax=Planctomicrobium sp. SH668 TaxID=3448126 RepID=UPI003F5C80EC
MLNHTEFLNSLLGFGHLLLVIGGLIVLYDFFVIVLAICIQITARRVYGRLLSPLAAGIWIAALFLTVGYVSSWPLPFALGVMQGVALWFKRKELALPTVQPETPAASPVEPQPESALQVADAAA